MRIIICLLLLTNSLLLAPSCHQKIQAPVSEPRAAAGPDKKEPEGFIPLFNGITLDGWKVPQLENQDWQVVEGVIDCDAHEGGVIPDGLVSDQVCITMDFSASIVRIAGATVPPGREFDGLDILRLVETGQSPRKRTLFWRGRRGDQTWRAVRDGDMKYIRQSNKGQVQEYVFDLKNDVSETRNLLKDRPNEARRPKAFLADWEKQVQPTR